ENAFKHGISYQKLSFVDIQITLTESRLHFIIINSKAQNGFQKEDGGIGIENVVKRLDLLYAHNYKLELLDKEDVFTVNLSIPI
ncbi:MAG: histidine kinase, partial [Ignavibacteria bacterium]|nr:histidine kinase [Ignavibacteria bacterium]